MDDGKWMFLDPVEEGDLEYRQASVLDKLPFAIEAQHLRLLAEFGRTNYIRKHAKSRLHKMEQDVGGGQV